MVPSERHPACLRDCGLVDSRPHGRASLFSLATEPELWDVLAAAERLLEVTGSAVALCPSHGSGRTPGPHGPPPRRLQLGGDPLILADAAETRLCVLLSVSTLLAVGLYPLTGAAWLDPVAGFVIAGFALLEGREAGEGDLIEDDDAG